MTDKKQKATKVKCNQDESKCKTVIICGEFCSSLEEAWVLLELVCRRTQDFTKTDQEKPKIEQIYMYIWNPKTTVFITWTWIYIISMEIFVTEVQTSLQTRGPVATNLIWNTILCLFVCFKKRFPILTVLRKQMFSLRAPTVPKNEIMKIKAPTAIITAAGSVEMLENSLYSLFWVTAHRPTPIMTPPMP